MASFDCWLLLRIKSTFLQCAGDAPGSLRPHPSQSVPWFTPCFLAFLEHSGHAATAVSPSPCPVPVWDVLPRRPEGQLLPLRVRPSLRALARWMHHYKHMVPLL